MTDIAETLRSGQRFTPSRHNAYEGTPSPESRWTVEQLRTLKREADTGKFQSSKRNWEARERLGVHVINAEVETWGERPREFVPVPCAIIARSNDGLRRKVILPSGAQIWVDAK